MAPYTFAGIRLKEPEHKLLHHGDLVYFVRELYSLGYKPRSRRKTCKTSTYDDDAPTGRGQFGRVWREYGGTYWDRDEHTVKLPITLFRGGYMPMI